MDESKFSTKNIRGEEPGILLQSIEFTSVPIYCIRKFLHILEAKITIPYNTKTNFINLKCFLYYNILQRNHPCVLINERLFFNAGIASSCYEYRLLQPSNTSDGVYHLLPLLVTSN